MTCLQPAPTQPTIAIRRRTARAYLAREPCLLMEVTMGDKALPAWAVPALVLTLACLSISLFYGGAAAFLSMAAIAAVSAVVLYRKTRTISNKPVAAPVTEKLSMSEKLSRLRGRCLAARRWASRFCS